MSEILIMVAAVLGTLLLVLASLGVLRMPDLYHRIHPPTKSATLGLFLLLLAVAVDVPEADTVTKAALAFLFLSLTAPAAIHILVRTAYRVGVPPSKPYRVDDYAAACERLRRERDEPPPKAEGTDAPDGSP